MEKQLQGDVEVLRKLGADRATFALQSKKERSIDAILDEYNFLSVDEELMIPTDITFVGAIALLESMGYVRGAFAT